MFSPSQDQQQQWLPQGCNSPIMFFPPLKSLSTSCATTTWHIHVQIPTELLTIFNSAGHLHLCSEKISMRAKSINIKEKQILHLNVFSLVRKAVPVPQISLLPSCSVSALTWLSTFSPPLPGQHTLQLHVLHGKIHLLHILLVTHSCIKQENKKKSKLQCPFG